MDYKSLPRNIKNLPPKWARFCLDIEKFGELACGNNFTNKYNLVAVSGGADSTALLIISNLLARRSGGKIVCATVNHGLRPEAVNETQFVADLCSELSIPFKFLNVDVSNFAKSNGLGIEEAGRRLRYKFFTDLIQELDIDYLLTAHHAGDLGEDILMRLARGTGWPALGGMKVYDSKRKLLRPLLKFSKHEIKNFLRDLNCDWYEDKSNFSDNYTRNRIRNKIIPLLNSENPNIDSCFLRLREQADLDADFFNCELSKAEAEINCSELKTIVPKRTIESMHSALRCRLFKKILDKMGPGQALYENIKALDEAFDNRKTGKIFQFPGDKVAEITRNGIVFRPYSR